MNYDLEMKIHLVIIDDLIKCDYKPGDMKFKKTLQLRFCPLHVGDLIIQIGDKDEDVIGRIYGDSVHYNIVTEKFSAEYQQDCITQERLLERAAILIEAGWEKIEEVC